LRCHTDAAQSVGKLAIDVHTLPVDFLSFTAHKFYGPKGIGALYVRSGSRARLSPMMFGGGQERGLRPGTLPTHQMVGFATACTLARTRRGESGRLAGLRDRLWEGLSQLGGVHLNGEEAARIPDILSVSFEGVEGESLVTGLTELHSPPALPAVRPRASLPMYCAPWGADRELSQSTLRFSLGEGRLRRYRPGPFTR